MDNRTGVCVQRWLGPIVPVMIFMALWSWLCVWRSGTHTCSWAGPLLWSAGSSHPFRVDNLTYRGVYLPHNDIHSHGFDCRHLWLLWALLWSL